ncbi:MAG: Nitrogen permease regulator 2 [Piccolia ochrophora]|nr:MAG: Nitrogen permease regulator 2 [Piccolia ochrophora]
MIKSIFFSKFLTTEGPKVLHQVPINSIVPSADSSHPPLIDFEPIRSLLIPRQEFCDRLVTLCSNRYRVLSYPVCITSSKYDRNELIFNFAIVLEDDKDAASYATIVRKLARQFRALEEQADFLTKDSLAGKVGALCEIVLEDLNNYCECMIPIDESNTINIKLFPRYPPPPAVKAWHVPLSTVRLTSLMDENWDLTMQKIVPLINGVSSVRRIAELADADFKLVRKCFEHLLYYNCLLTLDIFQFSAIYAPTPELTALFSDTAMQAECAAYIASSPGAPLLAAPHLILLYTSFRHGQPLKHWCAEHRFLLAGVDVRRLVTFGVIKGILYRVQKYVVGRTPVISDTSTFWKSKPRGATEGLCCLDEISEITSMGERELLGRLRRMGEVITVHR